MMEKTYTNISLNDFLKSTPSGKMNLMFGKSRISSNYWIKHYENLSGWLFGDVGTFDDTNLKCCNIRKEELLQSIIDLPKKITFEDKVVIIDGNLVDKNDLKTLNQMTVLFRDLAINHNLTIMVFNRHEEN